MKLRSVNSLLGLSDYPTRRTFERLFAKKPRPKYCRRKDGKSVIDVSDKDWLAYIYDYKERRKKEALPKPPKKKKPKPRKKEQLKAIKDECASVEKIKPESKTLKSLKLEELREKIRGQKIKNNIATVRLKKDEGLAIPTNMAEFLFFGFMDKCTTDLLLISKKVARRLESLIVANDSKGIQKLYDSEISLALYEIVKQQKKDVEVWVEEHGGLVED